MSGLRGRGEVSYLSGWIALVNGMMMLNRRSSALFSTSLPVHVSNYPILKCSESDSRS